MSNPARTVGIDFALTQAKAISASADTLDVLIIGVGPAGIAASLGALEKKHGFVPLINIPLAAPSRISRAAKS